MEEINQPIRNLSNLFHIEDLLLATLTSPIPSYDFTNRKGLRQGDKPVSCFSRSCTLITDNVWAF